MTKRNKIIYWISTIWLSLGMLSTGLTQLFRVKSEGAVSPPGVYGINYLGDPVYLLTILGVWKILGVIAILSPKFPLLKEWAYAGVTFTWIMATISARASGERMQIWILPVVLLALLGVSYVTRPASRRLR